MPLQGTWGLQYVTGRMHVFESRRVRRLVGRLERGDDLLGSLRKLAREHDVAAGWVRALGAFEWVELCEYDQAERDYTAPRRFDAPCEILTLEGNLSHKGGEPFAHIHATVSRETPEGIEVLGGHLTGGQVFACELAVECYDDVTLEREPDEATGLSLWRPAPDVAPAAARGGETAQPPASDAAPSPWAQVAAASAAAERGWGGGRRQGAEGTEDPRRRPPGTPWTQGEPDEEDEPDLSSEPSWAPPPTRRQKPKPRAVMREAKTPAPTPEPLPKKRRTSEDEFFGDYPDKHDWIEHARFGMCLVESEDPQGGVRVKLPSGVRKTINLEVLEVLPPTDNDDGSRTFPVRPKRR